MRFAAHFSYSFNLQKLRFASRIFLHFFLHLQTCGFRAVFFLTIFTFPLFFSSGSGLHFFDAFIRFWAIV